MYELLMHVDELNVGMIYADYEKAITEFKECVEELLNISEPEDNVIMKIDNKYAICVLQNKKYEYKIELKAKKGVE